MKRKEKLDLFRATNSVEALRPDVRVPIWEPRTEFLMENLTPETGFGPQPQSVAFGRIGSEMLVRRNPGGLCRNLAFRYGTDVKATDKVRRKLT